MTTIKELRSKVLSEITRDDLQNLVIFDDDDITLTRGHYTVFIDGLTMNLHFVGSWQVEFGKLKSHVFHFRTFGDMPKPLQDLWKQKIGDNEPELQI